MSTNGFRDQALEQELQLTGLHPRAASVVFGDLTDYLGQPMRAIAEEYWRYRKSGDVLAQEKVARATEAGPIVDYYVTTPHYLYELSYWEASRDKQAWFEVLRRACRRLGLRRVLDFGGGVGGVCVFLREHGIEADHLDIPSKTSEYAAWRFARRNFPVRIVNAMQPATWPTGEYDAVVAWDVLEHIFDLDDASESVRRLLRRGGYFLSKSTFATSDGEHLHIHLAKHAPYQDVRRFNELLTRHGFRYLGQLKPDRLSRLLRACGFRYTVAGVRITPRLKHGGNFLVHQRADGLAARPTPEHQQA